MPLTVRLLATAVPVKVGEAENTTLPVPVAPLAVTPPIEMSVPKVWSAVQVLATLSWAPPPVPFAAAVMRPVASTVRLVLV